MQEALALKEGSVRRVFPGQFLDKTVTDVLHAAQAGDPAARTARKLLLSSEYDKEG